MFRVLRCIKCGHVLVGENDFVERIMDQYMRNIKIAEKSRKYRNTMLAENAMLRSYFKQILHWQNEEHQRRDLNRMKISVINKYIRDHHLISDEEMVKLYQGAEEMQKRQLEQASAELKRLYGEYESVCVNKTKSDPTANAAIDELSKGGK